jgi:hypothetical protein
MRPFLGVTITMLRYLHALSFIDFASPSLCTYDLYHCSRGLQYFPHHSNIAFCFHSIPSYTLRLLVSYPLIYASHATRNPLLRSTAPHTDILS